MAAGAELRVPARLRRGTRKDEDESIDSAVWLIQHMCAHLGLEDLRHTELLDFGCGVKFTQALVNRSLPVKKYVGIDVHREMIDFLNENVDDPRFEYWHIDAHNERYNPDGEALTEETRLPLGERRFDLICLFSVFTHLAPHDYRTLLKILRRYVREDGRLFYTLYIDEVTEGGHGLIDAFSRRLGAASGHGEQASGTGTASLPPRAPFRDLDRAHPLKWALYSEEFARELIEGSGWRALSLSPPDVHITHHFVCAPARTG